MRVHGYLVVGALAHIALHYHAARYLPHRDRILSVYAQRHQIAAIRREGKALNALIVKHEIVSECKILLNFPEHNICKSLGAWAT